MWSGSPQTNRNYFMGHASGTPLGDFYQGYSIGLGANSTVNYASKVWVNGSFPGPSASTQVFKWLVVQEDNAERRLGVNTKNPFRTAEIKNTLSTNWQLRLTNKTGNWTDFKTRGNGNLNIKPNGGKVGINLTSNPTRTLDVNGRARIRQVPVISNPDCIIVGNQMGGNVNSQEVRRIDFTGNNTDVLLGNGSFGPLPVTTTLTGNNGISINPSNEIQLGVPCNVGGAINIAGLLATQMTTDRVVYQKNQTFWFASANNETSGTGFGGQLIGTPFCGTGNTVEISANNNNPQYGNTNASGLRFTKLTSLSPTIANTVNGVNSNKVLTVDADGDVVLTDATNGSVGNYCGATANPLTGDYEIPMTGFNIRYTGQGLQGTNSLAVGIDCNFNIPAKISAYQNIGSPISDQTIAGSFHNEDVSSVIGLSYIGVKGEADGIQTAPKVRNIGGFFTANNADLNYGLMVDMPAVIGNRGVGSQLWITAANAYQTIGLDIRANNASYRNQGIYVDARGVSNQAVINEGVSAAAFSASQYSKGVVGAADGGGSTPIVTGVHGFASDGIVNYGIHGQMLPGQNGYAGYFDGPIYVNGTVIGSDANLKTNIVDYDSSLYVISQLQPKTFEYTDANFPGMNLADGHQYGLIAQEVETILPSIVSENNSPAQYDSIGNVVVPSYQFKGLNYEQFIPILIGGIQEQRAQIGSQDSIINTQDSLITNLNDRLTSLENCLSGILPYLCQLSNSKIQQNDEETQNGIVKELKIVLENNASIILEQNVPNPFAEQTVIEYFIPEAVQRAQIHFYDIRGQLIKSVEIEEMGSGKITVFASDLSTGTYTYTLVADGQVISTKKMVKTN